LDIPLYSFIAWYLSHVVPSELGVSDPLHFCFLPSYWFPSTTSTNNELRYSNEKVESDALVEAVAPELEEKRVVHISHLSKDFGGKKAVDGLCLDIYEGRSSVTLTFKCKTNRKPKPDLNLITKVKSRPF